MPITISFVKIKKSNNKLLKVTLKLSAPDFQFWNRNSITLYTNQVFVTTTFWQKETPIAWSGIFSQPEYMPISNAPAQLISVKSGEVWGTRIAYYEPAG